MLIIVALLDISVKLIHVNYIALLDISYIHANYSTSVKIHI